MKPILNIEGLSKHYGSLTAVDGLNLSVEQGQVYGILGPNGSGKTTTLGMVMDIIRPDAGTYNWFGGINVREARKRIGTLLETPNFYPYMNGVQNLKVVAHIKKTKSPDIDGLLEMVDLHQRKAAPFHTYSLGMKQRLAIAAAMVGNPDALIFDEPTNGLDPEGIAEVRDLIVRIAEQGKTIIMASHILDEVEKICSHVAIIKKGQLLATGSVGAIMDSDITIEVAAEDLEALKYILKDDDKISAVQSIGTDKLSISLDDDYGTAYINALAFRHNITLTHLVMKQKKLETEFLEITRNAAPKQY